MSNRVVTGELTRGDETSSQSVQAGGRINGPGRPSARLDSRFAPELRTRHPAHHEFA
jgi:hypothetical protein